MSRALTWNLTSAQVKQAIREWVERQGDAVDRVIIDNPNKAATIKFTVECKPHALQNPAVVAEEDDPDS